MWRISGFSAFFSVRFPHMSRIKRFSMPTSSACCAPLLDPAKGVGPRLLYPFKGDSPRAVRPMGRNQSSLSRRLQEPRSPQHGAPVLSLRSRSSFATAPGSRAPTREDRVRSGHGGRGSLRATGKVGRCTPSVYRCSSLHRGSSPPSGRGGGHRATTVCRRPWQIAYATVSGCRPLLRLPASCSTCRSRCRGGVRRSACERRL